jgi:antitoxin CptB
MCELSKLKWQCRRGTLELDVLLTRYLETGYAQATDEEQALFVELLTFEDDFLLELLLNDTAKSPPKMIALVQYIRKT